MFILFQGEVMVEAWLKTANSAVAACSAAFSEFFIICRDCSRIPGCLRTILSILPMRKLYSSSITASRSRGIGARGPSLIERSDSSGMPASIAASVIPAVSISSTGLSTPRVLPARLATLAWSGLFP
jgi:hypothetical protein